MASSSMPNFCPEHLLQVRPVQSHRLPQGLHVRIEGRQIDRVEFRLVPRNHREQGGSERHDTQFASAAAFPARQPAAVERVDFRLDPPFDSASMRWSQNGFSRRSYWLTPARPPTIFRCIGSSAAAMVARPKDGHRHCPRSHQPTCHQPREVAPAAAAGSLSYGNHASIVYRCLLVQGRIRMLIHPFAGHVSVNTRFEPECRSMQCKNSSAISSPHRQAFEVKVRFGE